MKYIVSIDIGGTTFNSGIFTDSLNQVAVSDKDKIRFYKTKSDVVGAIVKQVNDLIDSVNINKSDILGLGVGAPGPLDPKKGIILTLIFLFLDISKLLAELNSFKCSCILLFLL